MEKLPDNTDLVVYVDEQILVLNKPSELLSVPGIGPDKQDCLASRVQSLYSDALIVHRLDMSTSGLIVMARGKDIHREMSKQFRDRVVAKRYTAVLNGLVADPTGVINLPLITDWPNRPKQKVDFKNGKDSTTHYTVIERNQAMATTRIEFEPITGRTHQLRVHAMAIGHPILGDRLYADNAIQTKAARLLLHAHSLSFPHPLSHETMQFESEVPF